MQAMVVSDKKRPSDFIDVIVIVNNSNLGYNNC